jgi:23S rRNA (adenine2503-C2)-methyltransferase
MFYNANMVAAPLTLVTHGTAKRAFLDVPSTEMTAWLAERGEKPMRERQIRRWLLAGRAASFADMSDLSKPLRLQLSEEFEAFSTHVDAEQVSSDGTRKLLVRLHDGRHIECVMIPEGDRRTACISTQVGCGMGCVFCASGLNGVERNLTVAEIVEQLLHLRNRLAENERLTGIVVMGMGEPLANLDRLLQALELAGHKDGLHIGARHVTISTVGLPAKIRQLADAKKQYHLAVSLHAPNDELRNRIVPTNDAIGMAAILDAADYFFATTGRQVTYEYVLLGLINDQPDHARELAMLLRGRKAHVNLIPFNEVEGLPYRRPTTEALQRFVETLERGGVHVNVRKRKGADIDAACGQLRRRLQSPAPEPAPAPRVSFIEGGLAKARHS